MRILHVGGIKASRGAGGPNHSIRGLAAAQAKTGMEVGLLPSLPLRPGTSMEKTAGVCILEGPDRQHYNPWFISKDWIIQIREKFGVPDIVNFHSTYLPFQLALAMRCRQVGWPYIITPRGGMTYFAQRGKRIKKSIANFLCFRSYVKRASAIHALCHREAEEIQSLFDVKKIMIAPNGVEDYLLEAPKELLPADLNGFGCENDLILGYVGRINVFHKGLDLLLKALAILKDQPNGSRYKLFIIGPFHAKRDEQSFCSDIESLGLKDTVKLLGAKYGTEKLRYFLACDVFVHTSRFEGMPMAVLEAMALGKPCLVTPGSNMLDVVCEGGGWGCEADAKSIAKAIESAYEKKDSLKALGQKSQELMRERFTWRKVAERQNEEYGKLLQSLSQ